MPKEIKKIELGFITHLKIDLGHPIKLKGIRVNDKI